MKVKFIFSYFLLALFQYLAKAANILGVSLLSSQSHHIWNERLLFALAEKGHNVTILSYYQANEKHENYNPIFIDGISEILFPQPEEGGDFKSEYIFQHLQIICDHTLKTPELDYLLKYPKDFKFDLVLWDNLNPECVYPLVKRFGNPRLIGLSAFGLHPYHSQIMGHPHFAYSPFIIAHYSDKMTFWEKLGNMYQHFDLMWERRKSLKIQHEKAVARFGKDVDDIDDVEKKYDFMFVNYDPVMDYPQPLPPNIISVGGMQVKPTRELPSDLKKVMDDSKGGVIFFSLGSYIKPEEIDERKLEAFTKCFETLPYTVLWKIKKANLKLPKNVIIKPWYPQGDILAHKNIKLFITHGGSLSSQEAMFHGVPMVILPFLLDQFTNGYKLELRKFGKKIELSKLTPDYVCSNIKHVINSKVYRENLELVSKRIKDQPQTPVDRAIFWTEHVLRQGSSGYLSLATREMGSVQIYNFDVLLLVIVMITSIVLAVVFIYSRIFGKKDGFKGTQLKNKHD